MTDAFAGTFATKKMTKKSASGTKAAKVTGLLTKKQLSEMPRSDAETLDDNDSSLVVQINKQPSPATIAKLTSMTNLQYLLGYKLSKFPAELCSLPRLQYLHLGNTNIATLPEEIGGLKQLVELDLGGCKKLKTLPEGIAGCENLVRIDVRYSGIESVPKALGSLRRLRSVEIYGCDIAPAVIKKVAPNVRVEK
jgi:Leucine-rich repeat (LRR) protein